MAIVKFQTGQTVNFNGNPTPQDIDEVAKQLGIGSQHAQSFTDVPAEKMPTPDVASNLGAGIIKSALGTVAGVSKLGQGMMNEIAKVPGLSSVGIKSNPIADKIQQVSQPQNTPQSVGKTAGDIAQFFTPAGLEADATKGIESMIDAGKFAEKFGPEAGTALSGILKAIGKAGVTATSAAGVTAAQTGGDIKATIEGAAAGALSVPVGKLLESAATGIAKIFIPKSDAEAVMLQTYQASTSFVDRMKAVLGIGGKGAPSTAASTAFEKGLMGTESMIGVQAKRMQTKLWTKLISPALNQSDVTVEMSDFLQQAEAKITKETADPTRLGVLKNALNAIKEDFGNIGQTTLSQLQKYKEGWAEFVPEKAYKGQPISGALNDVRNTLAGMARNVIYNALGANVKQAYLDYGNLYGITALGRKAMTGAIKGGTGTTLKNILEAATIPIGTVGGQTLYKVGQAVEVVGRAGASVLRDVLGIGQGQGQTSTSAPAQ